MTGVAATSERIDRLLGELSGTGPEAAALAEELIHTLLEFYGAGLARIVEIASPDLVAKLAEDEHVAGLLVLHDLHPRSAAERVGEALESLRPYLGSHAGDVELLGIDPDGVLRLALRGSCDGCPSSTVTAKNAIEQAVRAAAPELTGVVVEGVVPEQAGPGGRPLLPVVDCPVETG